MRWIDQKRALLALSVAALGALLLVGGLSYRTTTGLIEVSESRDLTYRRLEQLQSLLSELRNAETGQRGYLLTGEESYLEPYHEAVGAIHQSLKDLRELSVRQPEQTQKLDALEPLVANKLSELQQTIELRKGKGFDPAQQVVLTGGGKAAMDEIRKVIADMVSHEGELMKRRNVTIKADARNSIRTQIVGTLLSCGLLLSVLFLLTRQIRQREDAERDMSALARQQAAVAQLGQLALSGGDLRRLMDEAVSVVAETLEVEYCKILEMLSDGRGLLLRAGVGWKEGTIGQAIVPGDVESQAGYTLRSREPVVAEDLRTETRFSAPRLLVEHGVVSGLSVIIPCGECPFGILGAHTRRRRTFDKDDVNFLQAVAHTLAAAIERKRAEEALRQQAQILNQIHDSVVSTDLDGHVTSWNQGATRLFGYLPEEALGKHISFVYPQDRQDFLRQEVIRPLQEKGAHEVEVRMQRKSGEQFHAHLSLSLLMDSTGATQGMIGYAMDISERKRAEEAERESEERFRQMAENVQEVFWMTDASGAKVLYVNPAYEEIWGRSCDSLYRNPSSWLDAIHPEDRERVLASYERLSPEGHYKEEFRIVRPDGNTRWIWDRSFPVRDETGRICRIVGIAEDISERKMAEQVSRGQTQVLVNALNALTTEQDLDRFTGELLWAITKELHANSSALWLYDANKKTATLHQTAYEHGILTGDDQLSHPRTRVPKEFLPGATSETAPGARQPIVIEHASHNPLLPLPVQAWAAAQGVKSILSVPLLFGKEFIGLLTVRDSKRERFTPRDIELAQALAHQVTLALHLTRLAERSQEAAVLQERNRVAREIHDTLAQGLTGIVVQLEAAEDVLGQGSEATRAHLDRARALARESLGEARRSVWALRPQVLEGGDLPGALRRLANQLTMGTSTAVQFSVQGTIGRLPPDMELHLLRVAQEALANALKHGRASEIRIELARDAQGVQLSVQDNGRGFDPRARNVDRGFGLISMHERAERIGAQLTVFSEPELGTRLVVAVPASVLIPDGAPQ